jgi:hypothetical protein
LIDTTHQTLEQVYNEILNYDLIQEYDLENKLSKLINTNDFDQITNLPEYAHEFIDINQ